MTITFHSATLRNFKCPYHANVMKMLEIVRRRIVRKVRSRLNYKTTTTGRKGIVTRKYGWSRTCEATGVVGIVPVLFLLVGG
jgi:hypothetical protein